jgi:hypothetical protein
MNEFVMADVRLALLKGVGILKQNKADNVYPFGMRVAVY